MPSTLSQTGSADPRSLIGIDEAELWAMAANLDSLGFPMPSERGSHR